MALILYIESATAVCSVAIADNGKLILERTVEVPREHARLLTVAIDDLMNETGYIYNQLDAIAVSKGPGSYTGLRIGVATAKGMCFALDKPLIAVDTLYSMAICAREQWLQLNGSLAENSVFAPMIDARRMEVYSAVFDGNLKMLNGVKSLILEESSFDAYSNEEIIFFGDGAEKYSSLVNSKLNARFFNTFQLSATGLIEESYRKYLNSEFEDSAYFEPFYLKDFVAGPKKS